MKKYLYLSIILLFLACKPEKKKESPAQVVSIEQASEEDLFNRLMDQIESNPITNYQKERNNLLNYALDNLIDVEETDNGLFYYIHEKGTAPLGAYGDRVKANYKGYFLDGKVFDSSKKKGKPHEFFIGNMIPAWDQGLTFIGKGGKIILLCPSHLAYGEEGVGKGLVKPNTPLIFEIELVEFVKRRNEK